MTTNKFNIAELYSKAFGLTKFNIDINQVENGQAYIQQNDSSVFTNLQTIPSPETYIVSSLGTPILEQIVLKAVGQDEYVLPGWPLYDVQSQKNIVKTLIPKSPKDKDKHRYGTVKEFISNDDYYITIRGMIINERDQSYPERELQEFLKTIKVLAPLNIQSAILNQCFDIHSIVIERYELPTMEGYPNVQPFVLNCLSDEPIILEIKSVKTHQAIRPGSASLLR
jgi:hypothetical protein